MFAALALSWAAAASAPLVDLAEHVPSLTLKDVDGAERSLEEWSGRPLIVNFWAPWCGPCRTEIPEIVRARGALAERGFVVIGVALDTPDAVAAFAKQTPIDYDVLIVGDRRLDVPQRFSEDILGLPATVFVDDRGRLVWGRASAMDEEEILLVADRVERVDAGELTIEQAREEIDAAMAALTTERLSSTP